MVHVEEDFFATSHGKISCDACHGGDKTAYEKDAAHQNIVAVPSDEDSIYCEGCHKELVDKYAASLHKTQEGYFQRIENRLGYSIKDNATLMQNYNAECGKCHVSCGQCHVQRPIAAKGGFLDGHSFGKPDRDNNCVACHGSRVGSEYLGQDERYYADAHRYKSGGSQCTFCHSGEEMHSSGTEFDYRYLDTDMPKCEDCHFGEDFISANSYHQLHVGNQYLPKLQCQVCHSQDYKNCNGCHTGGSGITGESYFKFKIAKNNFNLEATGKDYDYVTVRHIPIVPDTYASWGIADLPYFDSEPTWKYTTPHNIQKWTARTDTTGSEGSCSVKCHDSVEYYLTNSDLEAFEVNANKDIIMDDKLPK